MKYDLYDFDGTIYDGDSGIDMIKFAISKYPKIIPTLILACIKYILKLCSKEEFKSKVFSFVKYVDDMDVFVSEYWGKNHHKIKDFWNEKENHKNDIIISASCEFWLKPIAEEYKIKDLFATKCDIKTGKILGDNCHGKEKVRLFYEKYPKAKINKMYTDSVNDLPLIEEANEGILVKKNILMPYYDYKPNVFVRFWRWGWGVYDKKPELWNYLIVGGLTTLVNLVVKWGMWFTICDPKINDYYNQQLPVDVSWVVAVLFAYVTNRIYVFKSKNKNILKEMSTFIGARLLTWFMEKGLTYLFLTILAFNTSFLVILQTIIIQVLVLVFNYIFSKLFVFRKGK